METLASSVATVATVLAACMTASNLGSRITGYGFGIFTIGSIAWLALGLLTSQPALVWTNIVMTGLNIFGIWRWLGRQAKVEDGAHAAAEASRVTPGEALFPVSLLTRSAVAGCDQELGTCVDAMAGGASGRIAYVVVAEGGIAGVGETLRRMNWEDLHVADGRLVAAMSGSQFEQQAVVQRDRWPDR